MLQHFPAEYEVVAVNLPAHGGSGCDPDNDLTFLGMTQRLRQVRDGGSHSTVVVTTGHQGHDL